MKERGILAMEEERTLYVGMDIRENKIHLCAYPPGSREIKMILEDFPLELAMEEGKKKFQKPLLFLKEAFPNDFIKSLAVSVETPSREVVEGLRQAFSKLGIEKDRLRIESHDQSFLSYVLRRKHQLWTGETGLLDGSNGKVIFRTLSLDRRVRPLVAGVLKEELALGKREALLAAVKPEIGTLYFTGSGFAGKEKESLIQQLCHGRRGFLGENLYCEGACISARRRMEPDLMEAFLFLEEDSLGCDISIPVYHDARNCEAVLAGATERWYEAGESICLLLDEEEEIPLKLSYALQGEEKVHVLALEGLWQRQPRMTKVLVKLMFEDKNTCLVTVKDLGFGEFCASSQRVWEKTITV